MKKSITIKRFTAGTLFRITVIGFSISLSVLSVLMGIIALFCGQVEWHGKSYIGIGLIASPFIGAVVGVCVAAFVWLGFAFSFWLFSKFRTLRIDYVADETA